ncbi:MAG: non-canonical purine NTP pyrophosphatase, partial [Rhodospirillaceae bacterium]
MTLDSPQSAARPFDAPMIVVASHNAGKVKEIGALLAPFKVVAQSAAALDLIEPEETGSSFIENAILKAKAAAMEAELPALADDSGLAVTALNGEPGIYSARWAGPDRDFGRAMERINTELGDQADR